MKRHPLRPADALNLWFSLLLLCIVLVFSEKLGAVLPYVVLYSSVIVLQLLFIRLKSRSAALGFAHDIVFPTVSILTFFDSIGRLVHRINPRDIDHLLIRADYTMLGGYPTVMAERLMHPLLTDYLQLAYSSYYFLPVGLGVFLLWKKDRGGFEYSLFLIMLCFYLSYIGYLLWPALGPRFTMAHLQTRELEGLVVAGPIQEVLNAIEGIKRDAFPSGHTGIALTVLYLSFRKARPLLPLFVILVTSLIFATVYCRYHYVVDVLAGILLAGTTVIAGNAIYRYATDRNSPRS